MRSLFFLILFSLLSIATPCQLGKLPRQNLQYGNTGCGQNCELWISRPDLGTTLTGRLYTKTWYTGQKEGWIVIGLHPTQIPLKLYTGQTCNLLVLPKIFLTVPIIGGLAEFEIFEIPNHPALRKIRLYAQGGMEVLPGKEGFSLGVVFDIM